MKKVFTTTVTRTDLLNHLAKKYNLQAYLEIGVQVPELNFDKIICKQKVGVDPDPAARATWCMTSDEFFESESYLGIMPDLVFIDGLHTAEQVKKDFNNALKILSPNGFIVLHDCNPQKEEHTIVPRPTKTGHWNGDVYKFAVAFTGYAALVRVTVDIDNGCMVYQKRMNTQPEFSTSEIKWEAFDKNRKMLLNLISWEEFLDFETIPVDERWN